MLRARLVDDLSTAEQLASGWDDLAVRSGRPYCAPAWMLSWWRNARPKDSSLAVVAVFDGDELTGLAPFSIDVTHRGARRCRVLASGVSTRVEPLALPGTEAAVAPVVVGALVSSAAPDFVSFEGVPATSPWPELFLRAWPAGRPGPWLQREMTMPAPVLVVGEGSFDEWLAGRGRNFRQRMRRLRRRLEREGATFRVARDPAEVERGLAAFFGLHHARWGGRGGSGVLSRPVEEMVVDAARRLVPAGRLRVWSIDVDGRTISAQVFVAAGGVVSYWLGGFDEAWAREAPGIQGVLAAVEDAWERGDRCVDLGAGGHDYKYLFTDEDEELRWSLLVPRLKSPHRRLGLVPWYLARATLGNLPAARRGALARRSRTPRSS